MKNNLLSDVILCALAVGIGFVLALALNIEGERRKLEKCAQVNGRACVIVAVPVGFPHASK